ncbi:MAG: phosphoadenosine phosphosulfate reductase family protein [Myxococcales bacterium]|nr:phosphoadenosine phosphosulfate reductase family protein [Myxococcales bacterium]
MNRKKIRHIMGLSGGKDSTGLAILLHKLIPDMEYFFCDTLKELPETYEYIQKVETRLGIRVKKLVAKRGFDDFLELFGNYLPSQRARWCTKLLKIQPLEEFVGDDIAYSYVGIRADEERNGYFSARPNIRPVYVYKPLNFKLRHMGREIYNQDDIVEEFRQQGIRLPIKKDGYSIDDVRDVINESGIGMPKYYDWRTRSGCYFCFYQRKYEWVMLAEKHPNLFDQAAAYEKELPDGRRFTWNQGETLREILERKESIKTDHKKRMVLSKCNAPDKTLMEQLEAVLDGEDADKPCLICTL